MTGAGVRAPLGAALAAGLVVVVTTSVTGPGPAGVVPDPGSAARAASGEPGRVAPEAPRLVRLPDGTSLRVRPVPVRPDGRLAVPTDVRVAGWWSGGARLGDPFGSTLVAAHVDSARQGLGPAVALLSTRPGQRVALRSARLRQLFRVSWVRRVPRVSFSDRRGLVSPRGVRRLVLVTCAPPYDRATGYRNLAVVVARPVDRPRAMLGWDWG